MSTFSVEATHKTPSISGNMEDGILSIAGKCIPEDARGFFEPFKNWFLEFINSDRDAYQVKIDLEYFNTSTSSILLDIFRQLTKLSDSKKVEIIWIYEEGDIEMEEAGQDYQLMVGDTLILQPKPWEQN